MGRTPIVAALAAFLALVVGAAWWLAAPDDGGGALAPAPTRAGSPSPTPWTASSVAPAPSLSLSSSSGSARPADRCSPTADRPFRPVQVSVPGITTGAAVVGMGRDEVGIPGVVPFDGRARTAVAWDAPGVRPGSPRGNVLLNAHTWPDGSALGNRLLRGFGEGDRLALQGPAGRRLCYRVTERLEVPVDDAPLRRVYDVDGPPQVVVIVCSGRRTGPGEWTHRTIWFASPER